MVIEIPETVPNWINGADAPAVSGEVLDKFNPVTGQRLCTFSASCADDVQMAVSVAVDAQPAWAAVPPVQRGMLLLRMVTLMQERASELAAIVATETGKSMKHALGEVGGAAQCGLFYASEGQRLFGRTLPSGAVGKSAYTIRQPVGVAALVIAANTPIANVAWKIFPALICGNAVVLKASEDAPATARAMAMLAKEAGIPDGILNIVQGEGAVAGEALVSDPRVGVISFTGSSRVGQHIHEIAGARLARISLELGGKNPLVVCADANLDEALNWTLQSAFSNAGQRCASCSRLLVEEAVYEQFMSRVIEATHALKLGVSDGDDLGPVINARQLDNMLAAVREAESSGAQVRVGGARAEVSGFTGGYFMQPTLLEGVSMDAPIARQELFGPIATVHVFKGVEEAIALSNDCDYGLTAAIHTRDLDAAMSYAERVEAGMVVLNGGTFGSEPHMPFGGRKLSGNGTREPGTEALDVYSELKNVCINVR